MRTKIFRATGLCLIMGAAACTGNPRAPRSENMPLQTDKFFHDNPNELRDMLAECKRWKASNTPIGAIPAVIISNCANANEANFMRTRPKSHW